MAGEVREERAAPRAGDDHRRRGLLAPVFTGPGARRRTGAVSHPEAAWSKPVLVETDGPVRTFRLNRPDRLNAVSLSLYEALERGLEETAGDRAVRAVILTGVGRAFCAGADLKAHGERRQTPDERRAYIETGQRVYRLIQTLPQPAVAAVNGHAIGAGIELALSCDFIVVAEEARLRLPEVALGTFVGGGTAFTLRRRVGYAKAAELILLGEFFSGRDALDMGLANSLAPAEDVLDRAGDLADRLAKNAPISMRLAKRVLDLAARVSPEEAMRAEADALEECMASEDWREGLAAFAEGRVPNYRGE